MNFSVLIGENEAVVGFRNPSSKDAVGEGENIVRDGEVRVASHCLAVLGMPSSLQYKWTDESAAAYVAKAIPGARVVGLESGEIPIMTKSKKKKPVKSTAKKPAKAPAKTKTVKSAPKTAKAVKGGPRKCAVCSKRGHNARSHLPGGLLSGG